MVRKKLVGLFVIAVMTAINPIVSFGVSAAEIPEENKENLEISFCPDAEIKELNQIKIESFESGQTMLLDAGFTIDEKLGEKTELQVDKARSSRAVIEGSVSDYLTEAGDAKIYSIEINPGILLQARLVQPSNSELDYDLYLFDSTGTTILDASQNRTHISSAGTLDDSVGIINTGNEAAAYYLYVNAAKGGSINEAFTLTYAVSNIFDSFETDEHPSAAKNFTFGIAGAYIDSRSISSSIDSDWYVIHVPSSRSYDKLHFDVSSPSANQCKVEVYKDASGGSFQMKKLSLSYGNLPVSTGEYYIKVSYAGSNFNQDDVQNYNLSLTPVLAPQGITITGYNSGMGANDYPSGYVYGKHYRAKKFLDMIGYVTVTDSETGDLYGIPYTGVTGNYINENWEGTDEYHIVTGTAMTDDTGKFTVSITLPPAVGAISQYITVSTHYYDYCGILLYVTDKPSIRAQDFIYHFAYSI